MAVDLAALERLNPAPKTSRRRVLMRAIAVVAAIEIGASMAWPRYVRRLSVLPRPPGREWNSGCVRHHGRYEVAGLLWSYVEANSNGACTITTDDPHTAPPR